METSNIQDEINALSYRAKNPGFTLIELVMVILLLGVVAAVAVPNYIDFRREAKNSATKAALGAMRSAIAIARAAIALKESPDVARQYPYPTEVEMQNNLFMATYHPVLAGTAILSPATGEMLIPNGIPANPWTATRDDTAGNMLTTVTTWLDPTITASGRTYSPALSGGNANLAFIYSHVILGLEYLSGGAIHTRAGLFAALCAGDETNCSCDPVNSVGTPWIYDEVSGEIFAGTNCNGEAYNTNKTELWY